MIHKQFEKFPSFKVESYIIKKNKVDLSEFNDSSLSGFKASFDQHNNKTMKQFYIKENKKFGFEGNNEKKNLLSINYEKLIEDNSKQIYHLSHFQTSDEEDNDTGIQKFFIFRN
jgi:hypothetical protein